MTDIRGYPEYIALKQAHREFRQQFKKTLRSSKKAREALKKLFKGRL